MKKILTITIFLVTFFQLMTPGVLAITPVECFQDCRNNGNTPSECTAGCNNPNQSSGGVDLKTIFGTFEPPQNVAAYSADTAGLINLLSNILKLSVVAAGVFGLINLVTSGIQWAGAAGNPEMIKQASSRIWMSLLGLVIVAGAFVLAGVIGLLFFGSATAIINPVIFGPAAPPTP